MDVIVGCANMAGWRGMPVLPVHFWFQDFQGRVQAGRMALLNWSVYFMLLSTTTIVLASAEPSKRQNRHRKKEVVIALSKGLQCYNCLSHDHPGCWDPDHPDYDNITIPSIDCYIPGVPFTCIVITAESANLVETKQELGPVRARTCVPAKEFKKKKNISYSMCERLAKELAASEVFSRVNVHRPKCMLCKRPLCIDYD